MLVSIWDELIPGRLIAAEPIAVDVDCLTVRELLRARAAQHGFAEPACVVQIDGKPVELDEPVVLREESDVLFLRKQPAKAGSLRRSNTA